MDKTINHHLVVKRAKKLAGEGKLDTSNNALRIFLFNDYKFEDFITSEELLKKLLSLDDNDIWGSIKIWRYHNDKVLAALCQMLIDRNLFGIRFFNKPVSKSLKNTMLK